jgi:hypothetical protein
MIITRRERVVNHIIDLGWSLQMIAYPDRMHYYRFQAGQDPK